MEEVEITLRPAVREDAPAIAALYRISSGGVADYIWQKLAEPGESPLEVGIRRYARQGTAFSYENCLIADNRGTQVGMINAFAIHEPTDPAANAEEDPVLRPYAELEVPGSLYISGVALLPAYRGRGIGTRMIRAMHERARREGLPKLSLIAFAENQASVRLYERLGYLVVDRRPVVPHLLIRYGGEALLMVASA